MRTLDLKTWLSPKRGVRVSEKCPCGQASVRGSNDSAILTCRAVARRVFRAATTSCRPLVMGGPNPVPARAIPWVCHHRASLPV